MYSVSLYTRVGRLISKRIRGVFVIYPHPRCGRVELETFHVDCYCACMSHDELEIDRAGDIAAAVASMRRVEDACDALLDGVRGESQFRSTVDHATVAAMNRDLSRSRFRAICPWVD